MLISDGSLVLTGREKDTIVLTSGENIEPGPLEEALISCPLIEQAFLLGQDQKHLGALLVPRTDLLHAWARKQGLSLKLNLELCPGDIELRKLLRREMNKVLLDRPGSRPEERLFAIALVKPFTIENGLLTQTLKQRRPQILQRDLKVVNEIYHP